MSEKLKKQWQNISKYKVDEFNTAHIVKLFYKKILCNILLS